MKPPTFIGVLVLFFGMLTCGLMSALLIIHFSASEPVSYYMKIGTEEQPMQQQVVYFMGFISSLLLMIVILKSKSEKWNELFCTKTVR